MILLWKEDLEFEWHLGYTPDCEGKSWSAMGGAVRSVDARGISMSTTSDGVAPLVTTRRPT
jgi:hypothetical protein